MRTYTYVQFIHSFWRLTKRLFKRLLLRGAPSIITNKEEGLNKIILYMTRKCLLYHYNLPTLFNAAKYIMEVFALHHIALQSISITIEDITKYIVFQRGRPPDRPCTHSHGLGVSTTWLTGLRKCVLDTVPVSPEPLVKVTKGYPNWFNHGSIRAFTSNALPSGFVTPSMAAC